jgi:hypothetical protein
VSDFEFATSGPDGTGHLIFPDAGGWSRHTAPPDPEAPPVEDDVSELVRETPNGPQVVAGSNVIDNVAHFAVILPDPDQPDMCGGCGATWLDCPHRKSLSAAVMPVPAEAGDQRLELLALNAARQALGLPPDGRNYQ